MLADLGADVIKIESGAYLDPFRVVGKPDNDEGWWNRSPQFRFTNRNKRGLALNLKDPEGQRVIRELAAHCDVVVENFRRGVLDRAGLGYAALKEINPRIVFAAISSQGDTGPERMNVSFGSDARCDQRHRLAHRLRGRGAAHLGHGRELSRPDRVAVRHRHRDRGRHGSAPQRQRRVPRFLPARGRLLHPGRGNPGRLGRSGAATRPARQHGRRRRPAGCLPLPGRALDRRHARCGRSVARRVLRGAGQRGRRVGLARAGDRRRALQRRRRPAARHQPRRRQPGARRAAAAWSRACPIGSTERASPSNAPHPISASTPTKCCANFWATATRSWRN